MGKAGKRCAAIRGGSGAARSSRRTRLVQERRTGGTTALGARAPRRLLFSEGAHAERPADRFGGPVPSRQRRAAGADRLARRSVAEGPARIRWVHGQLSVPARGHRKEPRSLRQPRRDCRFQRREETVEERRPAAARHAAVVRARASSVRWLHPSRRRGVYHRAALRADPLAPPQDEVLILMVRSAATPRVSNHEAYEARAFISA